MSGNNDERKKAKTLFTSLDDILSVLPGSELRGDAIFREQPVDLETWLYDERYMNLTIRLSPIQMKFLVAMDNYDPETNQYTEFVAEWGKGSGKDFICALAGLRCVYIMRCLRDYCSYFGMARGTRFHIVNVAYTREQAQGVYLEEVKGKLGNSPWFIRQSPRITRSRIFFDNDNIQMVSTSADGDSAEGMNIIFATMDEASAFKDAKVIKAMNRAEGVKADRAADSIYKVLRTSSTSRFPTVGKVAIISYPRYRDDFTQTKRKENEENPHGFVSGPYATWEVNPNRKESDFEEDYRRNPEQAAAMYECKPPYSEDAYIAFPHRFIECVTRSAKIEGLENPIDDRGAYDPFFQGLPGAYYAIHVDLALKKDRCALALARQGTPVRTLKCSCNVWNFPTNEVCSTCGNPKDQWISRDLPTMMVTLLKQFKPRENTSGTKEVDFSDIREEILWLRSREHKVRYLSYDGWQSVDSIQTMRKVLGKRIVRDRWGNNPREEEIATTLSVDRDTKPHDTLKEFIYDGRFFITPPDDVKRKEDWETSQNSVAIAFREWRALRLINGKKIDHPIGGSKDFIDALAGAAFWVAQMPLNRAAQTPSIGGWAETPVNSR